MESKVPTIVALVVSHAVAGGIAYFVATRPPIDVFTIAERPHVVDKVLDGDTAVIGTQAIHVRGVDAPELGPWAHCWAEADLAGNSKIALESELMSGKWKPVDRRVEKSGVVSARFVDAKGYDLADTLRVEGHVAMTDGKWDWCGGHANLHDPVAGEVPPEGPQMWWPGGDVYDARAND